MSKISQHHRLFPWQVSALLLFCKKNNSNASEEIRRALSKYIEKCYSKKMSPEDGDLLHFKAMKISKKGLNNVKRD